MKRITTEDFIKRAREVHGNKYDYSKTIYKTSSEKVTITCPTHGDFDQLPHNHLKGDGCLKCRVDLSRSSTEEFIQKARKIHSDKYDYSKVNYIGSKSPVTIICPIHGEFQQIPNNHLRGAICYKCSLEKKMTPINEFLEKAKKVHDNKYDYTNSIYSGIDHNITINCPTHGEFSIKASSHLAGKGCPECEIDNKTEEYIKRAIKVHGTKYRYDKVRYNGCRENVIITCPIHGDFSQIAYTHLNGNGCPKCSGHYHMNTEEFINKAKEVYGDKYNYDKSIYVDMSTKVIITCPEHGDFIVRPEVFLNGHGCKKCSGRMCNNLQDFIKISNEIHKNKYDYSKSVYKNVRTKLVITCPKHGDFLQTPENHMKGAGCPVCKQPILEKIVMEMLDSNGFKYEYRAGKSVFDWLSYQSLDFYIPDLNIGIECQGVQHYHEVDHFDGFKGYLDCRRRDMKKQRLCREHGVTLLYFTLPEFSSFDPSAYVTTRSLLARLRQ